MPTNSLEYQRANYKKYYGTKEAIKKRVQRNAARRLMIKKGKVKVWSKLDVDHINWLKAWNWEWNLRVISRIKNRILGQKKAMKNRVKKYNTNT